MLVFGLGLSLLGVGLFCALLFKLATYALPAAAGLTVGVAAAHAGAGPLASVALGGLAALTTLALGWFVIGTVRSPILKVTIGLAFAIPAAIAGYHVSLALGGIGLRQGIWLQVLSVFGSVAAGATAWLQIARNSNPAEP